MRNTIQTIPAALPMAAVSRKLSASAAALFAVAFLVTSAPAAQADEYCITNGAQAAHGCGYASMEQCRAASAGIGGMCTLAPSAQSPENALAYQPKQTHSRSGLYPKK